MYETMHKMLTNAAGYKPTNSILPISTFSEVATNPVATAAAHKDPESPLTIDLSDGSPCYDLIGMSRAQTPESSFRKTRASGFFLVLDRSDLPSA